MFVEVVIVFVELEWWYVLGLVVCWYYVGMFGKVDVVMVVGVDGGIEIGFVVVGVEEQFVVDVEICQVVVDVVDQCQVGFVVDGVEGYQVGEDVVVVGYVGFQGVGFVLCC